MRHGVTTDVRTWWEDGDSVQEFVDSREEMFSLLGLVGDVVEDLIGHNGGHRATDLVVASHVGTALTLEYEEQQLNMISSLPLGPTDLRMTPTS